MAETTQFVIEGEMTLAYFSGERDSKHILIRDENAATDGPEAVAISERRLESYIADQLNFPDDAEFDGMFKKMDELRKKGLRPAEGQPDGKREGVRLRVTVEVLP